MSAAASRWPIRTWSRRRSARSSPRSRQAFERLGLPDARLWAEPGRALVAGGASVVVQVQQRRGDALYVNDGVYGSLADAGALGFRYPVRLIRPDGPPPAMRMDRRSRSSGRPATAPIAMRGPFMLPADVAEGDWIEIGQLGAYGGCLRTAFNGFDRARLVEVRDGPLLTAGTQAAREGASFETRPLASRARKSATDITCAVEAASALTQWL